MKVHILDDPWFVNAPAAMWHQRLRSNPSLRMCLASGSTPLPLYDAVAAGHKAARASFSQATVFALDEFGDLAIDDPGRCANMLARHLIAHVDLPAKQFHRLDPDAADLNLMLQEFVQAIDEAPLDLAILGVGLNGHLGMNEPGSTANSTVRRVDLHPQTIQTSAKYLSHKQLPAWGVTVGMRQFMSAKEVWILASGGKKSAIIETIARSKPAENIPATLLHDHPNAHLILDHAAAGCLAPTALGRTATP